MSTRNVQVLECLANVLAYNFQLIRGPVKMCCGDKSGTRPKVLNFKTNATSNSDKILHFMKTYIDNITNSEIILNAPIFQHTGVS